MLLLTEIIGKAYKLRSLSFFVYTIDEIPAIFSNLEPGAQPKLAHAYYIFPLWIFEMYWVDLVWSWKAASSPVARAKKKLKIKAYIIIGRV